MEKSHYSEIHFIRTARQFYGLKQNNCKQLRHFFSIKPILSAGRWLGRCHPWRQLGILLAIIGLNSCSTLSHSSTHQEPKIPKASAESYRTALWEDNTEMTWYKLQHISSKDLVALQSTETDPVKTAWFQLAITSKKFSKNTQQLAKALANWRANNPTHPANVLLPESTVLTTIEHKTPPKQIAIILPQSGAYEAAGQSVRDGFLNAYYANIAQGGTQNVKIYDSAEAEDVASLYQKAIKEGADFVVGPLTKDEVKQLKLISFPVPTLALNYSQQRAFKSAQFYQYGLLPEDEAAVIAERARKMGRLHAIVIAPRSDWGKRMTNALSTRWQAIGGDIQEKWFFSAGTNFHQEIAHLLNININDDKKLMQEDNDKDTLAQQRRQDFDVIFLFSQPREARVIVPLLRYYYANDIPIFASSAVYSGTPNPVKDVDLNGVTVCDIPWHVRVQPDMPPGTQSERLYAVGQDAYLLSQTLDRLKQLPNFPIYGTTGALTMSTDNQIHRRLPCHVIHNGYL